MDAITIYKTFDEPGTDAGSPDDQSKYNNRTAVSIPVNSLFFRDLMVTVDYMRQKDGKITAARAMLSEYGMGFPGLLDDQTLHNTAIRSPFIHFDFFVTMQFRAGSMEKDGLALPLPFPVHKATVVGAVNTKTGTASGVFRLFGQK